MTVSEQAGKQDMVITRVFDAPRERVFTAFTEPRLVKKWYGPEGFTAPVIEAELRTGGRYLYCMESPEGIDYWSAGVYREFTPPERIVAIDSFADPEGNIVPASYYGLGGDWPLESEVVISFEEEGGGTRITIRQAGVPGGADLDRVRRMRERSLDRLAQVVDMGDGCRSKAGLGERREED